MALGLCLLRELSLLLRALLPLCRTLLRGLGLRGLGLRRLLPLLCDLGLRGLGSLRLGLRGLLPLLPCGLGLCGLGSLRLGLRHLLLRLRGPLGALRLLLRLLCLRGPLGALHLLASGLRCMSRLGPLLVLLLVGGLRDGGGSLFGGSALVTRCVAHAHLFAADRTKGCVVRKLCSAVATKHHGTS